MATVIRLSRFGKRHHSVYRVVVIDSRKARDGQFIEQVGFYNPNLKEPDIRFDQEKVLKWLGVGAKPSYTVNSLLRSQGIMDLFHAQKAKRSIEGLEAQVRPTKVKAKALSVKAKAKLEGEKAAKESEAQAKLEAEKAAKESEAKVEESAETSESAE